MQMSTRTRHTAGTPQAHRRHFGFLPAGASARPKEGKDDPVQQELAGLSCHAKFDLKALWSPERRQVVFGCGDCKAALESGTLRIPNRRKDPSKNFCFVHCNYPSPHCGRISQAKMVRANQKHSRSQMHMQATGKVSPDQKEDEVWSNHAYAEKAAAATRERGTRGRPRHERACLCRARPQSPHYTLVLRQCPLPMMFLAQLCPGAL